MHNGIYGKLPSKRDFIAVAATRDVLLVWEAWLQGGMSASMLRLGKEWQAAFLKAPIWRFWLGAEICGDAVLGAFMPSIDGVGRYFPLTVFVRTDKGTVLPPPEVETQAVWFAAAESLLLSALDDEVTLETLLVALEALPLPIDGRPPYATRGVELLHDGTALLNATDRTFAEVFASCRIEGHADVYADLTFWWTSGGEDYPACALARRHMPDPFVFAGMLTGNFNTPRD